MGRRFTIEQIVERFKKKHGDKYGYDFVKYKTIRDPVIITCFIHDNFIQKPTDHLHGCGCNKCGKESASKIQTKTTKQFIIDAMLVHGTLYSYELTKYKNAKIPIIIICHNHGSFLQKPYHHLEGNGCSKCATENLKILLTKTTEQFVNEAILVHGSLYGYEKAKYSSEGTIEIICKKHGSFWQLANNHLCGSGCPRCVKYVSKRELAWLQHLNVNQDYHQKTIMVNEKRFKVDAYNPITNTIYEFNGDYWHGNPKKYSSEEIHPKLNKTYGKLYQDTLNKETILINAGYSVISIWESDWNDITKHNTKKRKIK